MKSILPLLVVATLPFCGALADAPPSKNAKVTLVYQHELPNVPGKSIKGVLVDTAQVVIRRSHASEIRFHLCDGVEGAIRSQVNNGPVTTYEAGQSFSDCPAIAMASALMPQTAPGWCQEQVR